MPDPIIGLLAFVGLCGYAVIGGATAAWWLRLVSRRKYFQSIAQNRHGGLVDADGWLIFTMCTVFWPTIPAIVIPIALVTGPAWLAKHTGVYIAKSLNRA